MTRKPFIMLALIFTCCTLASCGLGREANAPSSQSSYVQPLSYPDFLSEEKGNGYDIHYYSTAVYNSQGERSSISRTSYLVELTYTGLKSVLCRNMEYRGMDLSRSEQQKEEEDRLGASGEMVLSGSSSDYGSRRIHYLAYADQATIDQVLSLSAADELKDPVVFQTLYLYITDGNARYSITFRDFPSETNQQTIHDCLRYANDYFQKLMK